MYLGPPVTLADLLLRPEHSLLRQSWAPCDMRQGGTINADGFGIAWYPAVSDSAVSDSAGSDSAGSDSAVSSSLGSPPVRYRRATPLWSDENLPRLAETVHATGVLAAIRSATAGMPVTEIASQPFTEGQWLFSHNGVIRGWPDSVAELAGDLPVTDLMTMAAPTDSAFLWTLVRHRLRAGASMQKAVAEVVTTVGGLAPGSRLNILLTDGETAVASAWWHSLSVLSTGERTVIASEPLDSDPAWTPVEDRRLLVATRAGVDQYALDERTLSLKEYGDA